jgi:hypothetical protein
LHPREIFVAAIPMVGAIVSVVQVAVLLTTVVLPQLSVAVKILVVPLVQPVEKALSFSL